MSKNDAQNLPEIVERLKQMVDTEINDKLPRKVGVMAKNSFKQNFHDSGFRNNGLHKWKPAERQLNGSPYKTLTSRRNHLMSNISFKTAPGEVVVTNDTPYATIHNEGGTVNSQPKVTPQMRKMAWARFYKEKDPKWKALALTKKKRLNISAKIPQRQFMGESAELTGKINEEIIDTLNRISTTITKKIT